MAKRKAFLLRIEPEVYDALAKWAADELRSVNAQIEFLLAKALKEACRRPGRDKSGRDRPGRDRPASRDASR